MKRHIKYIIVHSTATFDPKISQFYGDFHYVVERNGEIKRIHPETSIKKKLKRRGWRCHTHCLCRWQKQIRQPG